MIIVVTVLAIVDVALRLFPYDDNAHANTVVLVLSILAAALVSLGSVYGGALVYEYGFNVETSGDHPAWHVSEEDVFHGAQR